MKCEVCGNSYDKAFTIEMGGTKHTFDAFECAIQKLAPSCAQRVEGPSVMQGAAERAGDLHATNLRRGRDRLRSA